MSGGKESTRQKMINIMYLILLAMLALNVSDMVLNAFKNINDSLETSTTNVNSSIEQLFTSFENSKLKSEPLRAKPIWEKAQKAKSLVDELNAEITKIKAEFTKEGDGIDEKTGDLKKRSNMDIAPNIMINNKAGVKLKNKINETRQALLALLNKEDQDKVSFSLEAKDGKISWEKQNFGEGTPLTAAMTILTKIQSDSKNAEADVVKRLFGNMDKAVVNIDKFSAVAVAPSSYVIQGQPYTAEVFLTASDSRSKPNITVNGSSLATKDGKGTYVGGTSSVGIFKWVGTVRVTQTDGQVKEYKTQEQTYQVAKPSSTVSPTKMNVIYAGIANPFAISAAGFPLESVKASVSSGSISGANGNFNVTVGGDMVGKEVTVNVSSNTGGKVLNLGAQKFRVKGLPTPRASVSGKSGGKIPSVQLKSENNLSTALEDFPFDITYKVLRYNVTLSKPKQDAVTLQNPGSNFSGAVKAAINSVVPGSNVIFNDIVVQGPDGRSKVLDDIIFRVN
ncbi:MAG: gliding motility protein GldM [Sphingobacteriaceae bacterium]|nr:gliding motility protein GldM [Sphingobacteriaceae bacterium]